LITACGNTAKRAQITHH